MQIAYCGLNNLGNTCYMNSLLQTLFMTRPFREALFKWKYDANKHPEQQDCIPYQLQLLFAKMQDANLASTDARGLVKSFQWDPQESFAQHDVQEFCRVLFDAIQQSCSDDEEFINQLYQSSSQSYVRCLTCQQESIRNDTFLDLSLTVRSEFDNVYNESLEKAIKHYLQPEKLDGSNKYSCEQCQIKVEAIKGLRLQQLSEIVTIQLKRFELDLNTFDRKKVNDYVSYPFVLDMNNFLKPYDDIIVVDEKVILEEREKLKQEHEERQGRGLIDDPLRRNRPINRKPSPGDPVKKQVQFVEQAAFIPVPPPLKQKQNAMFKEAQQQLDEKWKSIGPKAQFTSTKITNNPNLILTADEAYNLEDDLLFGNNMEAMEMVDMGESSGINSLNKTKEVTGSLYKTQAIQLNQQEKEEQRLIEEIEEESHNIQLQEDIQKLLLNGPMVYELYAVMIHSGGAQGGHYYSYVKSFENHRWYCYNDSNVDRIRWSQVASMFGEKYPKYNSGVSAYFLMYRRVSNIKSERPQLPQELKVALEREIELNRLKEEKILHDRREQQMEIRIRCFFKNRDTIIKGRKDWTLRQLKEAVVADLSVQEDDGDTRIRYYAHQDNVPMDTFTGLEDKQLQELNFSEFKSIILETKLPHEKFEEYDPHLILFKINMWRNDIDIVDEATLKPIKIFIKDDQNIDNLMDCIGQKTGIPKNKQILLRRNPYICDKFTIELNTQDQLLEPLSTLQISKSVTIYVEERQEDETAQLLWDVKFEAERFKCTVVFNDPRKIAPFEVPDYCFEMQMDSRKPLQQLKDRIADFLGIDNDTFIMKRASKNSSELKDMESPLRENGILGRGTIFLSMGKPSEHGVCKIKIGLGGLTQQASDTVEFDYQELFEMEAKVEWTVYQLKETICQIAKDKHQLELQPNLIRLRYKVNTKFGQVFKDQLQLSQYRIFDKQTLAVEPLQQPEQLGEDQLLLYVKQYNMKDFILSNPPLEIFVKPNSTLDDISLIISNQLQIERNYIEAIKINNLYSFCITDLVIASFDWQPMRYNTMEIGKQPWFIQRDSSLIIVRDMREVPNDLSSLRQKCDELQSQSTCTPMPTQGVPITKPKEKALKIVVVKKQEQQQQQSEILDKSEV